MLSGCKKCISTEYTVVEVKVVDKYHRASYVTPVFTGKVMSMISHPAVNKITVEYDGIKYNLNGIEVYEKYNDKVGQIVNGTLRTRNYDDGTTKHDITSLE